MPWKNVAWQKVAILHSSTDFKKKVILISLEQIQGLNNVAVPKKKVQYYITFHNGSSWYNLAKNKETILVKVVLFGKIKTTRTETKEIIRSKFYDQMDNKN